MNSNVNLTTPHDQYQPAMAAPLAAADERTWAMLAHLSALLSLFSVGVLGPIAAALIWLVYRERSAFVRQQALQSTLFQLAVPVLIGAMWAVVGILSAAIIGVVLIPVAIVMSIVIPIAALVLPVVAAYETAKGNHFRYPVLGDMAGVPRA